MSWQLIETAPKDKRILLWCSRLEAVCGRWDDERFARNPRPYWTNDKARLYGIRAVREDQPTHWMPLPTPPST